jgi:hypothetical protein
MEMAKINEKWAALRRIRDHIGDKLRGWIKTLT